VFIPGLRSVLVLCSSAVFIGSLALSGCHSNQHPDYRIAVYDALHKSDLHSINVAQDRGEGTITLTGVVGSMDVRQKAENIAKQAAPGYQIADRIQVHDVGLQDDIQAASQKAQLDSSIEDKVKAKIADDPALKAEKIDCMAFHGTLTLKGTVKSQEQRRQAEDIAKQVPEVQHVVNRLRVQGGKSSANS